MPVSVRYIVHNVEVVPSSRSAVARHGVSSVSPTSAAPTISEYHTCRALTVVPFANPPEHTHPARARLTTSGNSRG